jgi:hypothetical protein
MKVPDRSGKRHLPPRTFKGPLNLTCPECDSGPGWPCIIGAFDANGDWYERRKLKTPHPGRRDAWRDRNN